MKQFKKMVEFLKKTKAGKITHGKKVSNKWESHHLNGKDKEQGE